jgi:hypothetical protein
MKVALFSVGGLVALIVIVVVIGYWLPVKHRASRQAILPASATAAYAIVADLPHHAEWRKSVQRIELIPSVDGKVQFKEVGAHDAITFAIDEDIPGRRRVTRIADKSLAFGGTWTYEFADKPSGGSTLRITEDGEVYNPVFRVMSRTVFPTHKTIETFLADLSAKMGAPARITE